jgi:hypothetical protein
VRIHFSLCVMIILPMCHADNIVTHAVGVRRRVWMSPRQRLPASAAARRSQCSLARLIICFMLQWHWTSARCGALCDKLRLPDSFACLPFYLFHLLVSNGVPTSPHAQTWTGRPRAPTQPRRRWLS